MQEVFDNRGSPELVSAYVDRVQIQSDARRAKTKACQEQQTKPITSSVGPAGIGRSERVSQRRHPMKLPNTIDLLHRSEDRIALSK